MRIVPVCSEALVYLLVPLLFVAGICYGKDTRVEVVGMSECADCAYKKLETSKAFSGLHVTIDCKTTNGVFKRRGEGELDQEGKFKVSLPNEVVKNGKLSEECFVQLHSASATPCPPSNGLESSRIVLKSHSDGKLTFGPSENLKFSPEICTSAFLWPHLKHPWHKPLPKVYIPPLKGFGHPKFKKPHPIPKILPPPIKIYKKPHPPLVPIYKPKPHPIPKILPPPIPIYKKPHPPLVPIYKPKPHPIPKILPPPIPIYKKPHPPLVPIYKPKPPVFKIPPIHKKPGPPKILSHPKIPLKHFHHHPKFGHFPPIPAYLQNP